ncbi:unnamed protein product [Clonostachys chloroleuca]|uniref:Uncharacterized protein n=1 Tax=Clonostachys chloroleuca TaxID=1926264 RepID=A0AA35M2I3_9HYPO|nr:unnamed protein product [Clonostachys chloroleuca]
MEDFSKPRAVPADREEDEESVEETPPPSPTALKHEDGSTMSQRIPGLTPTESLIPPDIRRFAYAQGPIYARTIPEPPDVCIIQYKPEIEAARIEAARLNWNVQPQPVSDPPPQPRARQGRERWYNEVKNLNTKDFSHTEAKNGHPSSPMFCLPGVAFVGSPTDPKPTLPYLPPPRSYIAGSMYASSWSSRGAPTISPRSCHPAWSVSSRTALPKLHTKGYRHEPYGLEGRPGRAPRAPRAQYEPQPRHNETAQETTASAAEPEAAPAPAAPTLHDDLPHRVKGKAEETAASAGDAGAALPIREKQPVVDKDEEP